MCSIIAQILRWPNIKNVNKKKLLEKLVLGHTRLKHNFLGISVYKHLSTLNKIKIKFVLSWKGWKSQLAKKVGGTNAGLKGFRTLPEMPPLLIQYEDVAKSSSRLLCCRSIGLQIILLSTTLELLRVMMKSLNPWEMTHKWSNSQFQK